MRGGFRICWQRRPTCKERGVISDFIVRGKSHVPLSLGGQSLWISPHVASLLYLLSMHSFLGCFLISTLRSLIRQAKNKRHGAPHSMSTCAPTHDVGWRILCAPFCFRGWVSPLAQGRKTGRGRGSSRFHGWRVDLGPICDRVSALAAGVRFMQSLTGVCVCVCVCVCACCVRVVCVCVCICVCLVSVPVWVWLCVGGWMGASVCVCVCVCTRFCVLACVCDLCVCVCVQPDSKGGPVPELFWGKPEGTIE